jgi:hypothetical protein
MRIPTAVQINEIHRKCRGTKKDGHKEVAAWMYDIKTVKVTPAQREAAKMFTFATMYGPTYGAPARQVNKAVQRLDLSPNSWRTKDGRILPVSTMSDAHLANAIAMLHRKLEPLVVEVAKRATRDEGWNGDIDIDFPHDVDFGDLF